MEEILFSKEIEDRIIETSKMLGIKKDELVERAVLTYLDSLKGFLELKQELRAWERLSDEALLNFEHSL